MKAFDISSSDFDAGDISKHIKEKRQTAENDRTAYHNHITKYAAINSVNHWLSILHDKCDKCDENRNKNQ